MAHRQLLLLLFGEVEGPGQVAVAGHHKVVDVDGEVGVEALAEVYPHGNHGHDQPHEEYQTVGVVFEPEVAESCEQPEEFNPLQWHICGGLVLWSQKRAVRVAITLVGAWAA